MAKGMSGWSSDMDLNVTENEQPLQSTVDEGKLRPKRQIKLTEKGKDYQIELLQRNRSVAHGKLLVHIKKVKSMLSDGASIEKLEQARDALDLEMENFAETHAKYNYVLTSSEDRDQSYKWFDTRNRDYDQCRLKLCERIHALERELYGKPNSVRSSMRSKSSSSSARSRRVKAAATAAKLEVEMKFLDQETKLKRLQILKQIEMANAEERAMLKIEEEEEKPSNNGLTEIIHKVVPRDFSIDLSKKTSEQMPITSTGMKQEHKGQLDPQVPPFHIGVTPPDNASVKHDSKSEATPATNNQVEQSEATLPLSSTHTQLGDATLQEMVKLQIKQTELSAMIAEQQRMQFLPVQEPPIFNGISFDYPVFIRAFETIIENKVPGDKERLYFLNKYTTGKANEIIKAYVMLNSDNGYQEAKKLLSQRFGDPYLVSEAYKAKLKAWAPVNEGDSKGLQELSDFLLRCEEAMKTMKFMDDLNSTETLKQISVKLPSYSGVKWCRHAFALRKKKETLVQFHDLVSFVRDEAELATDPAFSPCTLKEERRRESKKDERTKPPRRTFTTSNSLFTHGKENNQDAETKNKQRKICPCCSEDHYLNGCPKFLKMDINKRKDLVKTLGLCYSCLGRGHISKNCKHKLTCKECKKPHPTSLHYPPREKQQEEEKEPKNEGIDANSCASVSHSSKNPEDVTNCMIIPVLLHHKDNPDREIMTYALLDDASDTTFVTEKVVQDLGIMGIEVKLNLFTMLGKEEIPTQRVDGLVVRRVDKKVDIPLPKAYSKENIPFRRNQIPTSDTSEKWPHLKRIANKIHPYQPDMDVGILIGCNCPRALKPREVILGKGDHPYAIRTLLGWGIIGPVIEPSSHDENEDCATCNRIITKEISGTENVNHAFVVNTKSKEVITPLAVKKMFEADFSERITEKQGLSQEDRRFMKIAEDGIRHCDDGHYEMPLPLKQENLELPNNRELATRRLNQLKKRFSKDVQYKEDYVKFMNDVIAKGYAEQVAPLDAKGDKKVWFIPHHGVYHPKKPRKIRVVFDCSAEFQGQSLNQNLLQGPDLTNNLVGVLDRFRKEPVAVMCDIESMFCQVRVAEQHRDLLRFLWWKDGDFLKEPEEFRMTVHLFGAASSPACANFALKRTAQDNEEDVGVEPANFLRRDFYVDDGLKSLPTPAEAVNLINGTKEMCKRGGFNLNKFTSNEKEVIDSIPVEDRAEGIKEINFDCDPLPVQHALGVQWCIESDVFQFKITLKDRPCTRRGILSTVSSVYDPLGFLAPVLLEGKCLLQMLCKDKVEWDDPVPDHVRCRWEKWISELLHVESLSVPRCYKPANFGNVTNVQLHHFSDASNRGYGQCSYLRLENDKGDVNCTFVMGKARVTPLKPVTIPRLELTAAVVSVKVSEQLKKELEYEGLVEHFWTDSKVVLGYIANETRRFHVFVANRVQQIQERTTPEQWHYVDTKSNPADDASRGIRMQELVNGSRWINGPAFLWKDESHWPTAKASSERETGLALAPDDPEIKKAVTLVTETKTSYPNFLSRLEYFSSWYRAKAAVAWCLRYLHQLKKRASKRQNGNSSSFQQRESQPRLMVADLKQAEILIIKAAQSEEFEKEIEILTSLKAKQHLSTTTKRNLQLNKTSSLYKLDPFVDDNGVLRVGGRLRRANLSEDHKFPIILPKNNHVSKLIVRDFHEKVKHQGRGITLNEIRSNGYWIIQGTAAVSKCIADCIACRKLRGTTQGQKMADLPIDRVEPSPPFTYAAVDYFGPWIIKEKRKELKRYGVLFTCLASRAVHLEISQSLNTDSFMNALRRFLCRRGPVRQLRSDQGTNFVGAKRELKDALSELDHEKIRSEMLKNHCDWIVFKMNVPSASHMGGSWERQIRTVRNVLSPMLATAGEQLDDESLKTLFCEVEAIVNSRPLTVDSMNDPDSLSPLTPNHLLTMKSKIVLPPPGVFQSVDQYSRKRWRRVQHLANEFWSRWRKEFIQSLQQRQKWIKPKRNLMVGDIVIIKDANLPRNCWKLGRVTTAFHDDDGYVRTVELSVGDSSLNAKGQRKTALKTMQRPIHKLVLLLASKVKDQG